MGYIASDFEDGTVRVPDRTPRVRKLTDEQEREAVDYMMANEDVGFDQLAEWITNRFNVPTTRREAFEICVASALGE